MTFFYFSITGMFSENKNFKCKPLQIRNFSLLQALNYINVRVFRELCDALHQALEDLFSPGPRGLRVSVKRPLYLIGHF